MVRAVTLSRPEGVAGKPGAVYYPLTLITYATPEPGADEVLVQMSATALNHRDLFIRQHLYPSISFSTPLLADGCGVILPHPIRHKTEHVSRRVILNPGTGWLSDPNGPENQAYFLLGGTTFNPLGTLQEILAISASEVELAPEHLTDAEAAALPLAGLTAWRALRTKSGNAERGRNILITGIGGGVALMALLFAVAIRCNVFVTSSSEEKLARARELGAKAGVNYHNNEWEKKLQDLLPSSRPYLDAVIDGAGGDVVMRTYKLLKVGGVIVSYGMTVMPRVSFPMQAVMKNIEVRGSTMGSRKEFAEMVQFVREHKIRPVVERIVEGIDNLDGINDLFQDMQRGKQFGKLVIQIQPSNQNKL
ncbi:hypothetical protein MMC22_004607 [Lobaria immixta]|nr:hypothetical protein [Lobaria immixta]